MNNEEVDIKMKQDAEALARLIYDIYKEKRLQEESTDEPDIA